VPPLDPSLPPEALVEIIRSLHATIESLQRELADSRAAAAEARREIARLVKMVEGLTKQLDLLLRERDEERREELARMREEAAKAAAAAGVGHESPPGGPGRGDPGAGYEGSKKRRRSKHGRAPKPSSLPRDTTVLEPDRCHVCGGERLLARETLVSEEYDYVRAHVRVRRTERKVCTCNDCDSGCTYEPPGPIKIDCPPTLGYSGCCDGDALLWCESGVLPPCCQIGVS